MLLIQTNTNNTDLNANSFWFHCFVHWNKQKVHMHYQAEFVKGKTTEKICIQWMISKNFNREGAGRCLSKKCTRVHNIDLGSLVIWSAATFKSVGFHFVEIDALVALNLWIRGLPDYFKIRPCITSLSLKMVCWGFEFVECFALNCVGILVFTHWLLPKYWY